MSKIKFVLITNVLVSLWQIDASGSVVARRAGALVDVDLAPRAGEAGRAETLRSVVDGNTETSVFAKS